MQFDRHIGIDYSGRGRPAQRLSGLQVYESWCYGVPARVRPKQESDWNWCWKEIATWLIDKLLADARIIVGIAHCFSLETGLE